MKIAQRLREARKQQGLTQQELANRASISLATLQNIEANRANPALSTLSELFAVLGLELCVAPLEIDWASLRHVGVPIVLPGELPAWRPGKTDLVKALGRIAAVPLASLDHKEQKAIYGFLWAIKEHFPQHWQGLPENLRGWFEDQNLADECIQLRRLSIAALAEYL